MRGLITGIALVAVGVLWAGASPAGQVGGLATVMRPGDAAVSATVAYGVRDVVDHGDDEVTTLKMLLRGEFGVLDGLDLYGLLGLSSLSFDDANFDGSLGPTLGIGARYGLLNFPESNLRIILDVQAEYSRVEDGSKRVSQQRYHAATYVLKEFGAAGRVGYFYPYAGLKLSYARFDGSGGMDDYHSEDWLGIFAGADYFVSPNVYFSGEAHLFDETSLSLGVGYRF